MVGEIEIVCRAATFVAYVVSAMRCTKSIIVFHYIQWGERPVPGRRSEPHMELHNRRATILLIVFPPVLPTGGKTMSKAS
jgi:hypothetical protein